ncbi:MAG: sirohydrochlorin nickelochelatase [Methanobrevibacter sp.]|uniref:sirohydrochlorin nickelochelatase n=1 Tax=Methanobrevibacter sp. TaxID=66852 RepID=UPI001B0C99EF|nr:sirohydrochlorin nickelochelatase [Methanobrevibacter sp.]MBO5152637.1 sirohydrochlorin nickelochelatase [Methanobrevibacter sp.]
MSNNIGILLISHGSSLPFGEITFKEIKDKFINKTSYATEVGYMKVSEPSIAGGIENLKNEVDNLDKIIALPVFLAPGIHTNIDIPILLGLEPLEVDPRCPDGNYPDEHYLSIADEVDFDGEIELLSAIGPDDDLLKFIDKRIDEALNESKLDEDAKTGVLLVSHGSRLKYNKEFISALYSKFEKTTDYPSNFGFMELAEPDIPTAIDSLLDKDEIDRLIVVPVFIAPGVHTTNDIPTILGLKEPDSHEHHHHHHDHEHGHEHHHHHHDLTAIDFDGEILYPEPIKADDILIDILIKKVNSSL